MKSKWLSIFLLILLLAGCNLPVPGAVPPTTAPASTSTTARSATPVATTVLPASATPAPTRAAAVSSLWHVSYPSTGARPRLLAAGLDAQARPLSLSDPIDLPLEQSYIGPRLFRLSAAPRGQLALAQLVGRDTVQPYLLNLSLPAAGQAGGRASALRDLVGAAFLGWHPDGKRGLFLPGPGDEAPLLVELESGKSSRVAQPGGEYPPSINALAFSPDGALLADALSHPPAANRPGWLLEIGLRPAAGGLENLSGGGGRRVQCSLKGVQYAVGGSLRWSPDGRLLIWVAVSETTRRAELWVTEVSGGSCRSLVRLSEGPDYNVPPAWSPDGSRIAALRILRAVEPEGSEGELLLIDPSGTRNEVLVPLEALPGPPSSLGPSPSALLPVFGITGLQWSPDGRYVALALGRGNSGEILAVEVLTRKLSPLAGPTPPLSPFMWK